MKYTIDNEMSKPNSCKYCAHRVECDKSYKRYVHEGTEHKCFYELKNDKRKDRNANISAT